MSEQQEQPSNRRFHLVFAIAVLIGAILLLVAMEWGAITGTEPPAPVPPPAESGSLAPAPVGIVPA